MLPQIPAKRDKKTKKQKKAILIRMLSSKIEHVKPKSTKRTFICNNFFFER